MVSSRAVGKRIAPTATFMLAAGFSGITASESKAETRIDVSFFYENLAPHGEWVPVEKHGWAWTPYNVSPDWRPYTVGQWVYSDEFGWTWVSDWDWGWAPFHYGRWYFDPVYGWTWVPGTEWAPAWVAWRDGDGYVGWAPLPPEVEWRAEVGLRFGDVDLDVAIAPTSWCFVPERHVFHPRVREYAVIPARNVTIIHKAPVQTRYVSVGGRIGNFSISVDRIERSIGHRVTRTRVRTVDSVPRRPLQRKSPGEVAVFAANVSKARPDQLPRTMPGRGRMMTPDEAAQRYELSRRRLLAEHHEHRRRLLELHERETSQIGKGLSQQALHKRHAAEQEALEREHQRRLEQLERWRSARREGEVRGPKIQRAPATRRVDPRDENGEPKKKKRKRD